MLPPLPAGTGTGTSYYVSPNGDDTHDGLSPATAWKTVDKAAATTFAPGDSLLLEGGATFTTCVTFSGTLVQSTAQAPFTLSSYGNGAFTIMSSCQGGQGAALTISGVNGFYLHGAVVRGNAGGARYGVLVENPGNATTDYVRIEGCNISGFYAGPGSYGSEIFVSGIPGGLDRVLLLANTLHGDTPTSPDDNGITGFGNGTNVTHALYQGNEVFNLGAKPGAPGGSLGNGILANGVDGGVIQYNVVHDVGRNTDTCGGPAGIWAYASNNVVIQYNESYGVGPVGQPGGGCDWNGFDLDGSVTNSTMQYNYAHDNFGAGYLLYIAGTWSGNVVRYNLSENDGAGVDIAGSDAQTSDLAVYNNTFYLKGGKTPGNPIFAGVPGNGAVGGFVANNIFVSDGANEVVNFQPWGSVSFSGLAFVGNDYVATSNLAISYLGTFYTTVDDWRVGASKETKMGTSTALVVDPKLSDPGHTGAIGGYDAAKLAGYLLAKGSPLAGVGRDLHAEFGVDPGPNDLFGAPLGNGVGSGFNVGADGAAH